MTTACILGNNFGFRLDLGWIWTGFELDLGWIWTGIELELDWIWTGLELDLHRLGWIWIGLAADLDWTTFEFELVFQLELDWIWAEFGLDLQNWTILDQVWTGLAYLDKFGPGLDWTWCSLNPKSVIHRLHQGQASLRCLFARHPRGAGEKSSLASARQALAQPEASS